MTLSRWSPKAHISRDVKRTGNFSDIHTVLRQVRERLGSCLFSEGDETLEEVVGRLLSARKWTVALAESCTGGLIGHRLTEVPGSSSYLDRGFVTYSNKAKEDCLGVPRALLRRYGAVNGQVAEAMAKGVRTISRVNLGFSVTGIAGPGGRSAKKPVGLVHMAIDGPLGTRSQHFRFGGNRTEIKFRSSQAASKYDSLLST